jgi:hypothetical protein
MIRKASSKAKKPATGSEKKAAAGSEKGSSKGLECSYRVVREAAKS